MLTPSCGCTRALAKHYHRASPPPGGFNALAVSLSTYVRLWVGDCNWYYHCKMCVCVSEEVLCVCVLCVVLCVCVYVCERERA